MILSGGKLYDTKEQAGILHNLEKKINKVLQYGRLRPETVVGALDRLAAEIEDGRFDGLIQIFGDGPVELYRRELTEALKRSNLEYKLQKELGPDYADRQDIYPLGVLFHIAAGNMDVLPAYSILEGLLTGNVNLMKLPQADHGLTVEILTALLEIEPVLADYIHVFDTPSSDLASMRQMAALADGIAVWGAEAAIASVRKMAPAGCRLIEWGPRLGFAYIAGYEDRRKELAGLAGHIAETQQLLCSSCQVIYLDTDRMEEIHDFCREFLPFLEQAQKERKNRRTAGAAAEHTLLGYQARIEHILSGEEDGLYLGEYGSLRACTDRELELSEMFGNCLVKRLPRQEILPALRRSKGQLQTVGLLCEPEQRAELTDLFFRAGLVRVMHAEDMSHMEAGEPHDGEYALRRYVRLVNHGET